MKLLLHPLGVPDGDASPAPTPGVGRVVPRVDPTRCEAKGPCVQVCPEHVFKIRPLSDAERTALPWRARFKVWVHGGRQAFVTDPGACAGCGRCVPACPEKAISLHPVRPTLA